MFTHYARESWDDAQGARARGGGSGAYSSLTLLERRSGRGGGGERRHPTTPPATESPRESCGLSTAEIREVGGLALVLHPVQIQIQIES